MKKTNGKLYFGIFLLILQLLAVYGSTLKGNSLPNSFIEIIGFFIPGIIGISLIIVSIKSKK